MKNRFAGRYPVVDVDGARIQFPEGWGLVRPSNTQPILVLRAEAKTKEALTEIKRELADGLRPFGLWVDW